mmetsp:Transcript_65750/g.169230  ORF Transcript_65750/g.169230 Transcript_65750/m.169230 type:complete len:265 (-) Transcript_65750:21-815(-)
MHLLHIIVVVDLLSLHKVGGAGLILAQFAVRLGADAVGLCAVRVQRKRQGRVRNRSLEALLLEQHLGALANHHGGHAPEQHRLGELLHRGGEVAVLHGLGRRLLQRALLVHVRIAQLLAQVGLRGRGRQGRLLALHEILVVRDLHRRHLGLRRHADVHLEHASVGQALDVLQLQDVVQLAAVFTQDLLVLGVGLHDQDNALLQHVDCGMRLNLHRDVVSGLPLALGIHGLAIELSDRHLQRPLVRHRLESPCAGKMEGQTGLAA